MGLELIKDTLRFEQVVGEGQSQALVNRDIIVPDIKPDIATLLSVEGKVNITSKDVEQGKIAVEGDVNFQILYRANGEPQPIYSMNQSANFSHYIDVPEAMPKMEADVKCDIEHIDYDRVNGRKLNMQCVLNLRGKVTDTITIDTIKEISGKTDMQLLRDTVMSDELIGENTGQTVVRSTVTIPQNMPQADEILKYSAMVHNKSVKIEDGRIVIDGSVLVPVLFSSKDENPDIFRVSEDMLFSHTIEMPGAAPDMSCYADCSVEDIYAEVKEDDQEEKRQIELEVVLSLKAKVTQRSEFPVVIDAYAPSSRIECEKKNVAMDLFFAGDSAQAIVKESLALSGDLPVMEKVYDMICKPMVTDTKVMDDKVVVEGVVKCFVIYLARGDERLVDSYSDEVPFRASVVIPGCKAGMKPDIDVDIESMDFTMLTKNEVEVKVILNCYAQLYDKVCKDFIVKMEEADEDAPIHKPSITIYMVQPKDTLWAIAKKYYTTVDDIMKVNEMSGPDSLSPGIKLIIPKKIYK